MTIRSCASVLGAAFILLTTAFISKGQSVRVPTLTEILDGAGSTSKVYLETFKNLIADETKTFVIYKRNGDEKKRRTVTSNFIVFPLTKQPDRVVEFRNVVSVDGKTVKDGDKRVQELFEKISDAKTTENEIKRLTDESLRHDEQILISGMTLFQSVALESELRPFFRFDLGPMQQMNGRSVFVVTYDQVRETAKIAVNSSTESGGSYGQRYEIDVDKDVPLNARLSGNLFVDAENYQILAEDRKITIQPEGFTRPLAAIEDRFEFQESEFGILTPKQIIHTQYRARIKDRKMIKEAEVTFRYGNFSRPDIEVKADDVKAP